MHPKFLEWALNYLDSQKNQEKYIDQQINHNIEKELKDLKGKLSGLTMMRLNNLLNDEEYLQEKTKIKDKLDKLEKNQKEQPKKEDLIELTKEYFIFSTYALKKFQTGNKEVKREIITKLGSHHTILSKKPNVSIHKWLLPIYNNVKNYNAKLAEFAPTKFGLDYTKNEALNELRLSWHGR